MAHQLPSSVCSPGFRLVFWLSLVLGHLSAWAQLPSGWTNRDIGSPGVAGSASYSGGTWTVAGGGADIWGTSDQFQFAYQSAVTNYGAIVGRVLTVQSTNTWAKAGVMFRDSTAANSMFAMVVATPGNGVNFQWRATNGGTCAYSQAGGVAPPVWVKLARSGSDFAGYYSPDGASWTPIGPSQSISMRTTAPAGLAVTAHNNAVATTATFSGVTATNTPAPSTLPPIIFGVYRQLWTGLNGSGGLGALTNSVNNTNWPSNPNAAYTKTFTNFETEVNLMNAYGQRLRTFVVPPADGNYVFWIASDDNSELDLSSDENPANKTRIAFVPGSTGSREWTKYLNQQSAQIYLEGGRRYYLEALMVEGGGSDNLAVRWQMPGGNFEEPMTASSAAGTRLVPFDGVDVKPGVYQQTTNQAVVEGQSARFSVLVTNTSRVAYQWTVNAASIAGATKPFYTVSNVTIAANNGQVYRCIVTNSAGTITNSGATLTVLPDTNPPTVLRAISVGATNVQIVYSERVEAATATNKANYVFTNGLAVTQAVLGWDNVSVMLTTAPLVYGSNYALVINRVRDRANTPNTIATNTTVRFTASPYATLDVGNPPLPAVTSLAGGGVDLAASGNDIGGYGDQFGYSYTIRTGDFDVAARLASFSLPDVWAKAGLMARETMDPASRFAASLATPAMNGCFFEWRNPANANSSSSGGFPVNYPYTWLRLKRAGNTFTGFAGYDGLNWVQLGSSVITMPSQVYFGMTVSSHSGSQAAIAQFRDIFEVTNAVVGVIANPHEPPGPSSRKTPIAITEIMFKPAPRADTNNLEFIEIYNSNPWFHDISGYQLVGRNASYTFPAGTVLPGGAFLVIAASPQSIQSVYGISNVAGPYTGSLKNPDTLRLLDERGAVLLTVPYSNDPPWPVATDGTGHSLTLAFPTYGEEDPRAWDVSDVVGGSPGGMDPYRPSPLRSVVINEFLAHTDPPDWDYIELYNHANQPVDISGCILTDDPQTNRYVIPAGTVIPARGFAWFSETNMNFALSTLGETIYFKSPDQRRYLDAVHFGGQENGVATGRWPDGANDWYRLSAKTPGTNNASFRLSDVVINELMYRPISGDDNDQYVELYNRSAKTANLSGWVLSDGISFTFPTNTLMAPDSYLVVARDALRLRSNYANLTIDNCLGNFTGKLAHGGDRVTLRMPDTTVTTNLHGVAATNLIHITVNEVAYGTGGRWGQWASGGGSSLELKDPNSNNRLAANWADSDETQKSSWTNIETTGVLDLGANFDPAINYAQVGLLDAGECLVDDIEILDPVSGFNLVLNPDFESGTTANWSLQGCMSRSGLQSGGYGASAYSLRIRASSQLFTGDNSCQMALATNSLAAGQTTTIRFKARWLRGWPEVLLRLNGNWLEATGPMPVPVNLGTPGARNSQFAAHAGPAIYSVSHSPALPDAYEAAVVTARAHDANGAASLTLYYRLDPATAYTAVPMVDDGTGGDAIAQDGVFSATIPGQAAKTMAAFYIEAQNSLGTTTRFPALIDDNAPTRECLVMFGDGDPGGSFGAYHLWVSQTNAARWVALADLSNESHDCTMVSGSRVIYNMQARWAGSPYHQGFDTPYGKPCHYRWNLPDDDKFLGTTSFNQIHQPGNGAGDDPSIQREQMANTFLRALGVPWLNRRYIAVYVNGNRRGTLMEDAQRPDADVVEENFPDDEHGWLYKMQPWFEFGPFPQGMSIPFANKSWCNIVPYLTTDGVKKPARYRHMFLVRRTPASANDFSPVFSVVDAASTYGTPGYVANLENVADMENWMRVFAANHAAGNWDAFGSQNGQNLYGYTGARGTKYSLLMFDFNIVLGNAGSWSPGQNLFRVNGQDTNVANIYQEPTFRRMYLRALQELVNGPLDITKSGPLLDAKYEAFTANGLAVESPDSRLKTWVSQAHDSIAAQIATNNASFSVSSTVNLTNDVAYITGTAPLNVSTIWVNGGAYPLTWTSVTNFRIAVALQPGTNRLSVVGVDMHNQPVSGASNLVSVVYTGALPSPVGQVVINEIMSLPTIEGAEYLELFNNSRTISFDLSGFQVRGLSYTFPPGSVIGPTNYLVLAANSPAFARAYGVTIPVFDTFPGVLQPGGETLKLIKPSTNVANDVVVAGVKYDTVAPWPAGGNLLGRSLQLVDPAQENSRVANWGLGQPGDAPAQWVYFWTNGTASSSTLYLYLQSAGDIYLDDVTLVAGTVPDAGPNLVANGDFESLLTGPWAPAGNFTQSALSTDIKHSGNSSLHLVATAGSTGSGNAVVQTISPALVNGQPYALSFWYLQTVNGGPLTIRLSGNGLTSGSVDPTPSPPVFTALATPGAANSISTNLPIFPPIWINELQAGNLTGPTNSAGQRGPWLELYNPTTNVVSLAGVYLADNYENLAQWSFPAGTVINPGQFKVVFADGQPGLSTTNEPHTTFVLPAGAGSLALSRLYNGQLQVLDYVNYTNLAANHSYGSLPDGQSLARMEFYYASPGGTNNAASPPLSVSINEWMAANSNTLVNPVTGKYNDWFELYNYGTNPVNLAGYYLTDTITNKFKFQIPNGYVIPPQSFLLVWADNKNTSGTPDLHVTFKLSRLGSDIGLFGVDGRTVDFVSFGPQQDDISQGRYPDGGGGVFTFKQATPRTNNLSPNAAPVLAQPSDQYVYAGQTLAFALQAADPESPPEILTFSLGTNAPAGAGVTANGVFSWTPTPAQGPSTNVITVTVTDNGSPPISASKSFTIIVYAANTPPWLAPIPDRTVYANTLVSFTASATDTDQPPQVLTFTLGAGAPTGASISSDGVFGWTPTAAQAPSTNTILVIVTDSGQPVFSATRGFTVTVLQSNTAPALVLESAPSLDGQFVVEAAAVFDTVQKTVAATLTSGTRFYRLSGQTSTRIRAIRLEGNRVILTYE